MLDQMIKTDESSIPYIVKYSTKLTLEKAAFAERPPMKTYEKLFDILGQTTVDGRKILNWAFLTSIWKAIQKLEKKASKSDPSRTGISIDSGWPTDSWLVETLIFRSPSIWLSVPLRWMPKAGMEAGQPDNRKLLLSQLVVASSDVPSSADQGGFYMSPPLSSLLDQLLLYNLDRSYLQGGKNLTLIEVDIKWVNSHLLSKQENFRHPDRGLQLLLRQGIWCLSLVLFNFH